MDEAKRAARRKLLAGIKGPWDSSRLEAAMSVPPQPPSPEVQAVVDAAAARFDDDLPAPISVPTMDELDAGWDEDDDDDEEDEVPEEDASEPELPDEGLDPIAYAEAKRARDVRNEARRERRRAKADAKKARRKARAEAAKGKQKAKTKKARPAAPARVAKVEAEPIEADVSVEAPPAPAPTTNRWIVATAAVVLLAAAIAVAALLR